MTNSNEVLINNARIVLEDQVLSGHIQIRDGKIWDIGEGVLTNGAAAQAEDFDGDYLLPGFVELHTDHVEGHYAPRPSVRWNPMAAVLAHDAQIAASGITTVFDALRVGLDTDADLQYDDMWALAEAFQIGIDDQSLRADHFLHLRCEVSADDCLSAFSQFENHDLVKLISVMDHSPGQRQFTNIDQYAVYYKNKLNMNDDEFRAFCDRRIALSQNNSDKHRSAIAQICQERGFILASHDDATLEHVQEAIEQDIHVAEFPTTFVAAKASHDAGMAVLMGAPNVVRGGSHSGNIAAQDLAEAGVLDILSSDYIPFSLVQAVFYLADKVDAISLPHAVKMVSSNPAKATGLTDRGEIAIGKRADFSRVKRSNGIPVVHKVWREGQRIV
ncbi:alpha-D-ribose 1-methylphosphonate 5-triphosphate diphosphatase [Cohaesibacter gelatinilyticus]|uniref:Alpha-D-ribose 1-methylphosphonate 5-triphosphate diphosphatase n=1 Tax=Cohaesibacter gelatinilyticus TaxID=372072 RepID=A0A285NHL2_9HYPH|nr:alpha-D-ribose 1-methylphosphonate 5-triphosphate diphosphatase [Cohaesibacter gelatinilyticus]SNZ08748.1 alpha-D-ribose 1-methylphosphonate 5-triphosphate diphosphatase [Cohaesibacter gelatinilyticus]